MTGIRRTATGYGGRNRQADGAIGCFIHRADLDYCRVRYEMMLVLVQLFSSYKRYRYGTSAVAPLGLSSPLLRTALCCLRVGRARNGIPRGCPCRKPYEVGHSTAPLALLTSEERSTLEAVL